MTTDAIKLLSRLAGVSSPGAVAGRSSGLVGDAFASLLGKAQTGQVSTDQVVSTSHDVALNLTPEQQQRLGGAVDQAQAAGLDRALVLMDGLALVVDVESRTIEEQLGSQSGVLDGVDGVVSVPPVTWSSAAGATGAPDLLPSARQLLSRLAPGMPVISAVARA